MNQDARQASNRFFARSFEECLGVVAWRGAHLRLCAMAVFASLEQVQVPPGTAAGGELTVSIQAKRKGQTVAVAKQLWRASGRMPVVQPRKVQESFEPRHSLRPSALERVRMNDSRAQPIDGDNVRPAGARRWVGDMELPFETNAADIGWLPGPVNGNAGRAMPVFQGAPAGFTSTLITGKSSARTVMRRVQLSPAFKAHVVDRTKAHSEAWDRVHNEKDGVERSFKRASMTGARSRTRVLQRRAKEEQAER